MRLCKAYSRYTLAAPLWLGLSLAAWAQNSTPTDTSSPEWSVGPISFSGLVDGYFNLNFNHPQDRTSQLRAFDVRTSQFTLNMAKLTLEHPVEPVGFRVDLGFGRGFDLYHFNEPDFTAMKFVQQAFVSWKPAQGKGFQADFGKFVTSAGAEVFETHSNWNYSRSLLYALAQPYYHFGLRTSMPVGKHFTGGFQVVNGWNNVEDNNTGKTMGFTTAYTHEKFSWLTNIYVGPEKTGTNTGWRNIYDTVLNLTPTDWFSGYIDYYHGREAQASGPRTADANWDAIGLSGKFQLNDHNALAFRYEYFADHDGFPTGYGSEVNLQSFTATYEYKWTRGLAMRTEYRRDISDQPFFERGGQGQPLNPGIGTFTPGPWKNQDTLTVGFIAFFGGN